MSWFTAHRYFRHYKGGIYELLFEGVKHTETGEDLVVYQHVWPNPPNIYARPRGMFFDILEDGTAAGSPRFRPITKTNVSDIITNWNRDQAIQDIQRKPSLKVRQIPEVLDMTYKANEANLKGPAVIKKP